MKQLLYFTCIFSILLLTSARSFDDIERELRNSQAFKILRAATNQTESKGENPLNLPANSTSIRENITDTFSCENRTYGYYADVDNECQVFHVCLPSQTPSGRNVTYKWSFICPKETVFNQEVLVCTRPIDAIPCEDSPMYYDINMEFGKTNDTKEETTQKPYTESINSVEASNTTQEMKNRNSQRRKPERRKENLVAQTNNAAKFEKLQILNKDPLNAFVSIFKPATYAEPINPIIDEIEITDETMKDNDKIDMPDLIDAVVESEPWSHEDMAEVPIDEVLESARLVAERSMKWQESKRGRNSIRFKADL